MNPLKQILDRRTRASAETVNAIFVSNSGNGWCTVTLRDTGATVLAKLPVGLSVAVGQEVIIIRADGSQRSMNSNYAVSGISGATATAGSPSVTESAEYPMATITSITPDPALLVAGGPGVGIAIIGSGFSSAPSEQIAPSYGSPALVDVTTPVVVSDTEIDLEVRATAATPVGDYALNIGTIYSEPLFFQVSAPALPAPPYLWAWAGFNTPWFGTANKLFALNPADGSTVFSIAGPNDELAGICSDGTYVYALTKSSVVRVKIADGTSNTYLHGMPFPPSLGVACVGGRVWYSSGNGSAISGLSTVNTMNIYSFNAADGSSPRTDNLDATSRKVINSRNLWLDGTTLRGCNTASASSTSSLTSRSLKFHFDTVGLTGTCVVDTNGGDGLLVANAAEAYVVGSRATPAPRFIEFDKTALTATGNQSSAFPSASSEGGAYVTLRSAVGIGGDLIIATQGGSASGTDAIQLAVANPSGLTLHVYQLLAGPAPPVAGLDADAAFAYVSIGSSPSTLLKVDLAMVLSNTAGAIQMFTPAIDHVADGVIRNVLLA